MPDLPGFITMSVTPFNEDGSIDDGALSEHLQFLAATGTAICLASVGTGERTQITEAETRHVYEVGAKAIGGKVPVWSAGIGRADAATTAVKAKEAMDAGLDGVYIYGPQGGPPSNRPPAREIETHFIESLEGVPSPVLLANNTAVTGYDIPIEIFDRLLDRFDQVLSVNSAHPDMYYNLSLIDTVGPRRPVFVSMTVQLLTALAVGAVGVMSPESNVAPRLCMSVTDSYKRGDYAMAFEAFSKVMRLSAVLAKYQNPRSQKAALTLLGRPGGGTLRRPYLPLDEAAHKDIARVLDELDIRKIEGLA